MKQNSRKISGRRTHPRKLLTGAILAATLGLPCTFTQAAGDKDYGLPSLGDPTSAIVSPQKEKELGQMWLRMFRSQAPISHDPFMQEYLESLVGDLVNYSELKDHSLSLVVIKNPTMNAFAVPGNVVGIHTGLFDYAETEDQFCSVLAHELGHLSQRHFARGLEAQRSNSIFTMAGLLASLVLAASTGDGEVGLAAISASQAAAMDSQLRYSRQNEQEADRIGLQTMVAAGRNPYAVPAMFDRMLRATRYTSNQIPEFMRTHPLTENRISDTLNRAAKYPRKDYPDHLDYHLMRMRAELDRASTPQEAAKRFQSELDGEYPFPDAARYGLVLAQTDAKQLDRARLNLAYLLDKYPDKVIFQVADADLARAGEHYDLAVDKLLTSLKAYPDSYPLHVRLAETYMAAERYPEAEALLKEYVKQRESDPYLWYLLAETYGLAGNILGVHEARAEYFILYGIFDKALTQLQNALKITKDDFHKSAIIRERIKDVMQMKKKMKEL